MELGATVCTPKNPNCSSCPLSDHCLAFEEVKQLQEENKNKLMSIKSENWTSDIEDCISGENNIWSIDQKFKYLHFVHAPQCDRFLRYDLF